MAAEGGNIVIIRYVYRGEEGEHNIIPREATHITVAEGVTFVRAHAFQGHPNIVEVVCHEDVEKIEEYAFHNCPFLRRVIMPGVKLLEDAVFCGCDVLTDVECGMLEIIKGNAFEYCISLTSISLLSVRIVDAYAFVVCKALVDVKFGSKLERIEGRAFLNCSSLKRITIPLKDGLITADDIFQGCEQLESVDLVERVELNDIIAALHLEEWRNDMNERIDSINKILPNARAGYYSVTNDDIGEKAQTIRTWVSSVLGIIRYQVQHQHVLNEATTTLQLVLPHDIAMNNVLPFLMLPSYTV
jgi:hypothetical protein